MIRKSHSTRILLSLLIWILFVFVDQAILEPILGQEPSKKISSIPDKGAAKETEKELPSDKISITHHSIEISGQSLK